jgi:hypothetical protein
MDSEIKQMRQQKLTTVMLDTRSFASLAYIAGRRGGSMAVRRDQAVC